MARPVEVALTLLARRDHSRWELASKLRRRGFDPDEVEVALQRCDELGYLDDEAYAERFVASKAVRNGWGFHRLVAELVRRGVDRLTADHAAVLDAESCQLALQTALRKAERRRKPGWHRLPQQRSRMVSSLVGCGFATDVAIRAVDDLVREREKADHASEIE